MIVQFRLRRADAVEWATIDPVLQDGEPGWEQDTNRIKMGDGVTPWSGLGYATYPATEFEQMIGDITQNLTELDASVAKAADSALTATTQANAAAASAVDASTSAADAETAATRAEAIGGTNDTQTASFVNNPASSTSAALTAKYAPTATSVRKGELVFRVTDPPFNAVPDGVTNCAAAINAAGLAASNAGNTGYAFGEPVVEFPFTPEGYLPSSLLTLQPGVTYHGVKHVLIKRGGAAANYLFDASTKADVTVEGFTLDDQLITNGVILCGQRTRVEDNFFTDTTKLQGAAAYPVQFATGTTVYDVTITRNKFLGLRNNIHVKANTFQVTIEDNEIVGYSSTAIAVDGDSGSFSTNVIIRGNRIHDHDSTARAVSSKQISGNVATLNLTTAPTWIVGQTIYIDIGDAVYDGNRTLSAVTPTSISFAKTAADSGPTASSGYVALGNRQPISVQGDPSELSYHRRITISGNQVVGNYRNHQLTNDSGTADMISVHHTKVVVITDNIVEGSGDVGITISLRCWQVTVTGNTIVGASNCGIAVGAQDVNAYTRGVTISGNTIVNCGQGGVLGSWASCGINLRRVNGGIVESNYLGDDQAVATMSFGIVMGDSVGSCTDVHLGPNQYVGLGSSKRWLLPGNVRTTFADTPATLVKTADTASNLDGSAKNDPHLFFTPEVNSVYEIEGVLGYTTNGVATATPGVKIGVAPLAGASIVLSSDSSGSNGTGAATTSSNSNRAFQVSMVSTIAAGGITGATPARITFKIRLTVGPVAAPFQLTLAQQNADAVNAATLVTGSYMTYKRVA